MMQINLSFPSNVTVLMRLLTPRWKVPV
jgi:hypothetical protein